MKHLTSSLAVLALIVAPSVGLAAVTEPVKTDGGLVSGVAGTNADVRVFKGIPFAAPPVGPLRWKAPQPAAKWDGVRKAEAFGPRCMQAGGGGGRAGLGRRRRAVFQPVGKNSCAVQPHPRRLDEQPRIHGPLRTR